MIISKNNLACLHFLKGFFILILQTVMAAWLESFSIIWFITLSDEKKRREESDEGIDTNELNTVLSKSNIKSSADITEKFNELDTNKNGKLEESEVSSAIEGGGDYLGLFRLLGGPCGVIMCPLSASGAAFTG